MKELPSVCRRGDLTFNPRENSGSDSAEVAWARYSNDSDLHAGFCNWTGESAPPKTLDYDEILLVLSGIFGIQMEDGNLLTASEGDVIHIPKGTTVSYFGKDANVFFAVTTPESMKNSG